MPSTWAPAYAPSVRAITSLRKERPPGWGKNRTWRIAGSLTPLAGQHHAQHFDRRTLLASLCGLPDASPAARRTDVVLDTWPVHFPADSGVRLLPLPTYALWTNPEERIWRKAYAELFHLHDVPTTS